MKRLTPPGRARWIDIRRDLPGVLALLETSFGAHLDADGQRVFKLLRQVASDRQAQRWYQRYEVPGAPLYGYVWEDQGRIVGNVSLVRLAGRGPRRYLIVNVAVDPAYRRLGIARRLMEHALSHALRQHAQEVWLQVEENNPAAINLYRQLGFVDTHIVTLWRTDAPLPPETPTVVPSPEVRVRSRLVSRREWLLQKQWLRATYPPALAWHLQMPPEKALAPTLRGWLWRLFHPLTYRQWVAYRQGRLRATLTLCRRSFAASDEVLVAAPPDLPPEEMAALARPLQTSQTRRPLRAELPKGFLQHAMPAAGFSATRHLLWMRWRPRP